MNIPSLSRIKKIVIYISINEYLSNYGQHLTSEDIDLLLKSGNKNMLIKLMCYNFNYEDRNQRHYKYQVINMCRNLRKLIKSIYLRKVYINNSLNYIHLGIFSLKSFIKVFSFNKGGYSVI